MAIDLATKSQAELLIMAANYRAKGRTGDALYHDILVRIGQHEKAGLGFEKTATVVTRVAREGRFVSYSELAESIGLSKARARLALPKHLLELNKYAQQRGWPMLSAIVVTKEHTADGLMDGDALAGFCKCARALGEAVADEGDYLKGQQDAVFAAAKAGRLA